MLKVASFFSILNLFYYGGMCKRDEVKFVAGKIKNLLSLVVRVAPVIDCFPDTLLCPITILPLHARLLRCKSWRHLIDKHLQ